MTTATASRFLIPVYLLALVLSALALGAFWFDRGRLHVLPDAATSAHKLQCVSYSPFDADQSPLVTKYEVRPARIDTDFALLSQYFSCVRTYSMTGMTELPAIAEKYGLKVMLGAWVNADASATRLELEQLIAAANRYPNVVESVVVGNETLLRKEITGKRLAQLVNEVKSRIRQPVTYADVWEFWLRHPEVAPAVDFITIHLLPYWEDQPTGIDRALEHVADVREQFGRRFAPKDILIGETGWPSEGRQRETAVPSRLNQARFIRDFVAMAEHNGWRYNLIEAFDQPWKRNNEGAVGGYWGLFDAQRVDKHILAGPVSNVPDWAGWLQLSAGLALLVLLFAGRPRNLRAALLLPALAVLGGACVGVWLSMGAYGNRNAWEWFWSAALAVLNVLVLARGALTLAQHRSWRSLWFDWLERRAGLWLLASGFAGAILMLQLVFDPRYREFPSCALLVPALVYLAEPVRASRRELILLALIVAAGIPAQLAREGVTNIQAWGWAFVSTLLALALWRGIKAGAADVHRGLSEHGDRVPVHPESIEAPGSKAHASADTAAV